MKRLLLTVAALSLFAVSCNRSENKAGMENRADDSNMQREQSSERNSDIRPMESGAEAGSMEQQREEDMSEGAIDSDSSMGTSRGTGSEAGSSDAAGMGMDE